MIQNGLILVVLRVCVLPRARSGLVRIVTSDRLCGSLQVVALLARGLRGLLRGLARPMGAAGAVLRGQYTAYRPFEAPQRPLRATRGQTHPRTPLFGRVASTGLREASNAFRLRSALWGT